MNLFTKNTAWIAFFVVLAIVIGFKIANRDGTASSGGNFPPPGDPIPVLLDLGSDSCIPCKAMAPILEELRNEYRGRFRVEFIDVWKSPDEGERRKIHLIPTQIFYDASGKELTRHEGYFSREEILATWKTMGFDFDLPTTRP